MNYRNEWNSVVLPGPGGMSPYAQPAPYPGVTRQKMSYMIRGLQPGIHYEARVQAKNVHGWNKLSPVFHFSTRSAGNDLIRRKKITRGGLGFRALSRKPKTSIKKLKFRQKSLHFLEKIRVKSWFIRDTYSYIRKINQNH